MCIILFFFFFKQKTAYEMRISDWSSDVCSSDLLDHDLARARLDTDAPPITDEIGRDVRHVLVSGEVGPALFHEGGDRFLMILRNVRQPLIGQDRKSLV